MVEACPFHAARGSALVSTLLVIVVLTIIVTAFLQSMTSERQTAHSYLNRYRAELAAKAGLAAAMDRLESAVSDSSMRFVVAAHTPPSDASANPENQYLEVLPLKNGTQPGTSVIDESKRAALATLPQDGADADSTFLLDLTPQGPQRTTRRVAWQPLETSPGNKEVGRYGFWIDAASDKQDARVHAGRKDPLTSPQNSHSERDALQSLSELPLLTSSGTPFSEGQASPLRDYQYYTSRPKDRKDLLTPATVNQIAQNLEPLAQERDFTVNSPTTLLTPEGKPRLNLQRLKCYIDGDRWVEYGEGSDADGKPIIIDSDDSYEGKGLPVDQGPTSPRFELIKQLLNEDGAHPADHLNDWGYGNLEIVKRIYPEQDAEGHYTQARQFVANLIDYIDGDIIPTTDGSPGLETAGGTLGNVAYPPNNAPVITALPTAPTVFGVEAQIDHTTHHIRGHPYITYVGQGFVFNGASTRVFGTVGIAYPWSSPAKLGSGSSRFYHVEMQVNFTGTVSGGSRGTKVMAEGPFDTEGYLLHSWLAQESNFAGEKNTQIFTQKTYQLYPRIWANGYDLANGFFQPKDPKGLAAIQPASLTFHDLAAQIEVLRVIYTDPVRHKRVLVQDLTALNTLPRPIILPPMSTLPIKLGNSNYSNFVDWHYLGDPRLNFRADGWVLAKTAKPTSASDTGANGVVPSGNADIYNTPSNPRKDPLQGMGNLTNTWFNSSGLVNHFPEAIDTSKSMIGYRPSPAGGDDARFYGDSVEPAMLSYAELGFIHAGAPWETVTLFNDPTRFKDEDRDHADWRLLDYVDIGTPPRHINAAGQHEVYGQVNVNSENRNTLLALLSNIPDAASSAGSAADALSGSKKQPFLSPADAFSEENFKGPDSSTDADREKFVGQVYPALTAHSQKFTIYSVGESRDTNPGDGKVRTVSRVALAAEVELRYQRGDDGNLHLKPTLLRTVTP